MRTTFLKLLLTIVVFISITGCADDYDDNPNYQSVNNFIWRGLNQYYFWLAETPDLADNRFSTETEFTNFSNAFGSPDDFFYYLTSHPDDNFSFILADYTVLEQALTGNLETTGMEFKLYQYNTTNVFGVVTYVLPNSDAAAQNIKRGDVFIAINGTPLTTSNYISLLQNNSYALDFAYFDGNNQLIASGISKTVVKMPHSENPVYLTKTITIGNKKIGYLLYNGFYTAYENELNQAFAYFQSENITHFILDLRYNSGGSVATATRLASMLTGQFNNMIFAKQQWNYKMENYFSNNPESLINRFTTTIANGTTINSLQLHTVYVLTSQNTASASELVINGLKPYINVVQLGDVTRGKNVGSITLYDSPTYRKENVNPAHFYAMQPIVLKIANAANFSDYANGINPDVSFIENPTQLGILGETSDPFLATALNYIDTNGRFSNLTKKTFFNTLQKPKTVEEQLKNQMYVN
ncbi:S41 family peptidase [Flavobacterium sp.]|uniref:S41 family peptidase n=1 Tax=Flavobacterium sp. TaxID=239 RepID=UPI003528D7EB